jgi:hypothetical protein
MIIKIKDLVLLIREATTLDDKGRRIVRPNNWYNRPGKGGVPLRSEEEYLERRIESQGGTEVTEYEVTKLDDVLFDIRRDENEPLLRSSPFVRNSINYNAIWFGQYSEEELTISFKKYDPKEGRFKLRRIKLDYPDPKENQFVIIPELFERGELGVCQILRQEDLKRTTVDGKEVQELRLVRQMQKKFRSRGWNGAARASAAPCRPALQGQKSW